MWEAVDAVQCSRIVLFREVGFSCSSGTSEERSRAVSAHVGPSRPATTAETREIAPRRKQGTTNARPWPSPWAARGGAAVPRPHIRDWSRRFAIAAQGRVRATCPDLNRPVLGRCRASPPRRMARRRSRVALWARGSIRPATVGARLSAREGRRLCAGSSGCGSQQRPTSSVSGKQPLA